MIRDNASITTDDTIAAIASPSGNAPRGIVRCSGTEALAIVQQLLDDDACPLQRTAPYHVFTSTVTLEKEALTLPAVIYVMKRPYSYTREDVVEIHTIGSAALLAMVIEEVCRRGARLAEPGEFTKRAFLNGRIDLAQAEAVLKIISAASAAQMKTALAELEGGLSQRITRIRDELVPLVGKLEAAIDFSDQDISLVSADEINRALGRYLEKLDALIGSENASTYFGDGYRTLLAGKTNVGKSSIFNNLIRWQRAIISSAAATTRDLLEEKITIDGVSIILVDMAGASAALGELDARALELGKAHFGRVDILLFVVDASVGVSQDEIDYFHSIPCSTKIVIANKVDIARDHVEAARHAFAPAPVIAFSAVTHEGLEELEKRIMESITKERLHIKGDFVIVNVRQRDVLARAKRAIGSARDAAKAGMGYEFVVEDLKDALDQFALITGEVTPDDVLDYIFSSFCIGK